MSVSSLRVDFDVISMTAFGAYDAGSNVLTANGVSVFFGKVDATLDDSQD